jgi:hypothetical protein
LQTKRIIKIKKEKKDETDIIRLSWQHLPQSDGRVCDEGSGQEGRTGR